MMGFPAGYSEFIVSKVLFNAVFLLTAIRNGICWLLRFIGLAEFLEQEFADLTERSSAACSATADMIRERLPVVTFGVLTDRFAEIDEVSCSVCLNEFDECEEITQLTNCCHIFHKNCLDKWLDHDQKTCPLCRTCLMPEKIENVETEGSWAVERLLYLFGEDMNFIFVSIRMICSVHMPVDFFHQLVFSRCFKSFSKPGFSEFSRGVLLKRFELK